MPKRRKVANLLALAVLATVVTRPMHPYEIASVLRARSKDRDLEIKWGSLYRVVENLERHGFLAPVHSERQGGRPERTVYRIRGDRIQTFFDVTAQPLRLAQRSLLPPTWPSDLSQALAAVRWTGDGETRSLVRDEAGWADEAEVLLKAGSAVFIDVYPRAPKPPNLPAGTVWRDPTHMTIEGAHWLPNVGYGVLSEEFESYFKTRLARLTDGDRARPVGTPDAGRRARHRRR